MIEPPELATIGRSRSRADSLETITGAPSREFVVKRAAEVVSGDSDTSTPTSSPSGFSPAAVAAAWKPAGSAAE